MDGFFTKKEVESTSRPGGKVLSCASCKLYKYADSPKMEAFGNFEKGILNIGEAPGETEDAKGKQWQGKAGKALKRAYRQVGIDLFEDCLNINAVNCRPPDNRTPTGHEINCCREVKINQIIKKYKPHVIVVFGGSALQSIIGNRWKKDFKGITTWRGHAIPDRDLNCWIVPVFHPSYVIREEREEVETVWLQDLKKVEELVNTKLPPPIKSEIKIIKDLKLLNNLTGISSVAFDYETTGLKPHAKGHRIVCASICYNYSQAISFMMPETKYDRQPFLKLLNDPGIGKRAHNMKFEDLWTEVRFRMSINNWEWDSMIAAHLLDNRKGIAGLKFQTYVNFGITDYSSSIESYLQGDNKDANSFNKVLELVSTKSGQEELLTYCAYDSLYEFNLSMKQIEIIDYDYLPF